MADRIVVMRAGVVEQMGSPLDLYDFPANSFVGGFIGSPAMNLVKCTVAQGDTGLVCVTVGNQVLAPLPASVKLSAGAKVEIGIRPEDLGIGSGRGPVAEIVVVEPTGPETQATANLDGQVVTLVLKGRPALGRGDKVSLGISGDKMHVFDGETGRRI